VRVGIISGSGAYAWPGLENGSGRTITTEFGAVAVTQGRLGEVEIVHLSRHGAGHVRLSNHVEHHANLRALIQAEVDAVIAVTICGAVDPQLRPGTLVVFDDLYFPSNRLPDGRLCTWYGTPGVPERGHWIFDSPFSPELRRAIVEAGTGGSVPLRASGCYGHVDGPRFNSRSEVAALARDGVSAISQTAGPEVVLAGEAELPYALIGYVTDHANGVTDEPEPLDALLSRMRESSDILAALVADTCKLLGPVRPAGVVYRFESSAR
jgi:5'-methylthioadenosine phosphorylase